MRRSSRDRLVLKLLVAVIFASSCSRLTAIDWALIPAGSSAGTGSGATDSGGAGAGESSAGASPVSGGEGGLGGEGGELTGDEGGAIETGGTTAGFSGSAGFGGKGGAGGTAGHGGVAGSGGMSGSGGASGNGGTAGNGGGGPAPCTGTPSTVVATDLVLFDGGPGQSGDRGGRVGLDNVCKTALAKLSLPQTKTHAFTSVTVTDCIATMPQTFSDIRTIIGLTPARVVGPTGIQVAKSFPALISGQIDQSLACAAVVPMNVDTWLSGSSFNCSVLNQQTGEQACGQFGSQIGTCDSWTLGTDDQLIEGIYGSTRLTFSNTLVSWLSLLKASCDAATDNAICLAYTP